MRVRVGDETVDAYCPTTTRIGGLSAADLLGAQVPCLLSVPPCCPGRPQRRTRFTVEAISLDAPEAPAPSWVGINQTDTNRYMEHFLSSGALPALCRMPGRLQREQQLGICRIDFLYEGRDALEVKTPLSAFPLERIGNPHLLQALAASKKKNYLGRTDVTRFLRHLDALQHALAAQRRALGLRARPRKAAARQPGEPRAAVLHCHLLDAPPPSLASDPGETPTRAAVRARIMSALRAGIELWQVNLLVDEEGVTLQKYFPILK
ncbi:hypothetical protein WJX81_007637 [Elliptochloris bilobata]|uniref:Sugar fermentation stimulation protein C-terminal domain-containing protein n=1 Tax=Elliptochloris bilobata TaxID=381761 RepID=A0AAW1RQF2_9CHLO